MDPELQTRGTAAAAGTRPRRMSAFEKMKNAVRSKSANIRSRSRARSKSRPRELGVNQSPPVQNSQHCTRPSCSSCDEDRSHDPTSARDSWAPRTVPPMPPIHTFAAAGKPEHQSPGGSRRSSINSPHVAFLGPENVAGRPDSPEAVDPREPIPQQEVAPMSTMDTTIDTLAEAPMALNISPIIGEALSQHSHQHSHQYSHQHSHQHSHQQQQQHYGTAGHGGDDGDSGFGDYTTRGVAEVDRPDPVRFPSGAETISDLLVPGKFPKEF